MPLGPPKVGALMTKDDKEGRCCVTHFTQGKKLDKLKGFDLVMSKG